MKRLVFELMPTLIMIIGFVMLCCAVIVLCFGKGSEAAAPREGLVYDGSCLDYACRAHDSRYPVTCWLYGSNGIACLPDDQIGRKE